MGLGLSVVFSKHSGQQTHIREENVSMCLITGYLSLNQYIIKHMSEIYILKIEIKRNISSNFHIFSTLKGLSYKHLMFSFEFSLCSCACIFLGSSQNAFNPSLAPGHLGFVHFFFFMEVRHSGLTQTCPGVSRSLQQRHGSAVAC